MGTTGVVKGDVALDPPCRHAPWPSANAIHVFPVPVGPPAESLHAPDPVAGRQAEEDSAIQAALRPKVDVFRARGVAGMGRVKKAR